jgi:hypothetical protein
MIELIRDIDVIENVLIALNEGASDEKYAAVWQLEKLLIAKKDSFRDYDKQMNNEFLKEGEAA